MPACTQHCIPTVHLHVCMHMQYAMYAQANRTHTCSHHCGRRQRLIAGLLDWLQAHSHSGTTQIQRLLEVAFSWRGLLEHHRGYLLHSAGVLRYESVGACPMQTLKAYFKYNSADTLSVSSFIAACVQVKSASMSNAYTHSVHTNGSFNTL